MINRSLFLPLLISLAVLMSCKNEQQEVDYNPNVLSAKDYVRAEDAIFEIVNTFFKGIHDTAVINNGFGYIDACSIRYFPDDDSMTYGYGDVNRLCQDNKFRRGMFMVYFSGDVFEDGVIANLTTDSLIVDDIPYEAAMVITNLGMNINNQYEYNINVTSSLLILPDTNKIHGVQLVTDFTMEWAEGYLTPESHEDDAYLLTGIASGLSSDLYEFSVDIQEPLTNYLDCHWISAGLSLITVPQADYETGTIDYILADGCHNEMHFTFNDNLFFEVIK